ncbi:MAG: DUF817 family protein, partial [Bdellovibrionia bacterium]
MPIIRLHSAAMRNAALEFLLFGLKEARACIFAGSFFVVLMLSRSVPLGSLPRYDFILIAAIVLSFVYPAGAQVDAVPEKPKYQYFSTDEYKPNLLIVPSAAQAQSLRSYLKNLDTVRREISFEGALRWFIDSLRKSNAAIPALQSMRSDLPIEFRWTLAAAEISYGLHAKETIGDAIWAIRQTKVKDAIGLGGPREELSPLLFYRLPGEETTGGRSIWLANVRQVVFLHGNWMEALATPAGREFLPEFEFQRVRWMESIKNLGYDIPSTEILQFLSLFNEPGLQEFSSRTNKTIFLSRAARLAVRLGLDLEAPEGSRKQIKDIVMTWIANDFEYELTNFYKINRWNLANVEHLLDRKLTPDEMNLLSQMLKGGKLAITSHFIGTVLWLANREGQPTALDTEFATTMLDMIFRARLTQGTVTLALGGFTTQYERASNFKYTIKTLYDVLADKVTIDPAQARRLLNFSTTRPDSLTETEWTDLEWRRLMAAEHSLPADEFKEILIKKLIGTNASMHERL